MATELSQRGLYAHVMGSAWVELAEPIRDVHAATATTSGQGRLRVTRGCGYAARALAAMLRLPRACAAADTRLVVTSRDDGEQWVRTFDDRCLTTRQYSTGERELGERIGVLEFRFRLESALGSLVYRQLAAAVVFGPFRIPLPSVLAPRVEAREDPSSARQASELKLHAARDFFYAVLFGTLPWLAWQGAWVLLLVAVIVAEIILTLTDFVLEIAVRKALGDVYGGERVTHAVMGILYGAMVANLISVLRTWWSRPTALVVEWADVPAAVQWGLLVMAAGVFLSGLRDLYAAIELPYGHWPWPAEARSVVKR